MEVAVRDHATRSVDFRCYIGLVLAGGLMGYAAKGKQSVIHNEQN